jgi:hypothetical protein
MQRLRKVTVMNNPTGAERPAITRKVPWIAVAAILFILALGAAAFSQSTDRWYGLGPDNIMGMMPPNGMAASTQMRKPQAKTGQGSSMQAMTVGNSSVQHCAPSGDITLPRGSQGSYTYVSTEHGCIYTIKRDGKPWVTVTYDTAHGTYRLTDPNGTGKLLLELGIPAGTFTPAPLARPATANPN